MGLKKRRKVGRTVYLHQKRHFEKDGGEVVSVPIDREILRRREEVRRVL